MCKSARQTGLNPPAQPFIWFCIMPLPATRGAGTPEEPALGASSHAWGDIKQDCDTAIPSRFGSQACQATIIFPLQRQLEILLGLLTPRPSATITFPAAGCEFVAGFAGGERSRRQIRQSHRLCSLPSAALTLQLLPHRRCFGSALPSSPAPHGSSAGSAPRSPSDAPTGRSPLPLSSDP